MSSKPSGTIIPILCLLTTATLWGVSWYPLRIAESYGLDGIWIIMLTYGAASVVGFFLFFKYLPEFKAAPGLLILIGLANAWTNIGFIFAILDGNVVRVILLFYLSPIWSTLLGWLVLGERLSRLAIITLFVAMVGALVMLWDSSLGHPWPSASSDWMAITAGMAFSVANTSARKLQHVSIQAKTMSIWFGVAAVSLLWILVAGLSFPDVEVRVMGWTLLIGSIMIFIMTFTVQYGVTHMPVHRSAIILLFELVAAALSAQWLTDEVIQNNEWIGGILIITAAYLSARSFIEHVEDEDKPL